MTDCSNRRSSGLMWRMLQSDVCYICYFFTQNRAQWSDPDQIKSVVFIETLCQITYLTQNQRNGLDYLCYSNSYDILNRKKNCELDLSSKLVWNCGRAVDKVVEKVLPKKPDCLIRSCVLECIWLNLFCVSISKLGKMVPYHALYAF